MKTSYPKNVSLHLAAALLSFACLTAPAQDYRVLRHFAGGSNDGATPWGATLVQSGAIFYGMTSGGGTNNVGTIFQINSDGTGFQLLHSFVSGASDGQGPIGSLLLSGSTLYGMAACAGSAYRGTLFRLNTDGSGFQVLRQFSTSDGVWPWDSLIQSGSVLYGMNTYGGSASGWSGKGTIFRINNDGSGFQKLRTFAGGSADGQSPHGTFVQSGSVLYGTALLGGSNNVGMVFRINTNGTGFQPLHHFASGTSDGNMPYSGALVLSDATLYGMTGFGGSSNLGTIYKMNTNGAGYEVLHSFTGTNGAAPRAGLVLSGSTLYGMTRDGGAGNKGAIFEIQTNGTGFRLLHNFAGSDGSVPYSSLLLSGSTLYGTTSEGGSNNLGVLFALDLPRPTLAISPSGTNINLTWSTNFPNFTLETTGDMTGSWTSVPGVTGYSATLPINSRTNQFFRIRR